MFGFNPLFLPQETEKKHQGLASGKIGEGLYIGL